MGMPEGESGAGQEAQQGDLGDAQDGQVMRWGELPSWRPRADGLEASHDLDRGRCSGSAACLA